MIDVLIPGSTYSISRRRSFRVSHPLGTEWCEPAREVNRRLAYSEFDPFATPSLSRRETKDLSPRAATFTAGHVPGVMIYKCNHDVKLRGLDLYLEAVELSVHIREGVTVRKIGSCKVGDSLPPPIGGGSGGNVSSL